MFGNIFTVLIVQPIFNVLVFIYGLLPGHNFGLAIILFTILVRILLWPLLKKQLHQSIKMRALQPELKKIKASAKGNRQKEAMLMMELYKEKGVSPFSSIGVMLLQLPILLSLFVCLNRIIKDPNQIVDFAYPFLQNLPSIKDLAANINLFDNTLFGVVDLTKSALSAGGVYWPAMIIIAGSAIVQFYQSRQIMPIDKNARKLRAIMKEAAASGKQADQTEVTASVNRTMLYVLPAMVFLFGMQFPSALGLYWLVGSAVALLQQTIILRRDSEELTAMVAGPSSKSGSKSSVTIKRGGKVISRDQAVAEAQEAEVVAAPKKAKTQTKNQSSKTKAKGTKSPAKNTQAKRRKK